MNELQQLIGPCIANIGEEVVIRSSTEQITYAALNQSRIAIEEAIGSLPVNHNGRIALLLPKSSFYVAAILAAIQLEVAYIPIDYDAPFSRTKAILEDAACDLYLTTEDRQGDILAFSKTEGSVAIDGFRLLHRTSSTDKNTTVENLAFILYTSGSTGKPKGVYTSASNVSSFVNWARQQFVIGKEDVILSVAPFHFDLSTFDLFAALSSGGTLVLCTAAESKNPRLLAQILSEEEVTTIYATPTLLQLLLHYGKLDRHQFSNLRQVLFAGEVFPVDSLRKLSIIWEKTSFYNLYGPTETNVVTWFPIPEEIAPERKSPYPIGSLCPYSDALVKVGDSYYEPQQGLRGELWIAGASVSPGYANMPELMATRFQIIDEKAWYGTGDIIKVDEQDLLVYVGRIDRMIKRRGFRIELAEVEENMSSFPGLSIFGAIAIGHPKTSIIGCYQAKEAIPEIDLKQYLAERLPLYMLPDRFLQLDEIPLTSTQKIDYGGLKKIVLDHV